MGKRYAAEVDKELKPSEDQAAIERVQRIGGELAKIANQYQVEVTWGDRRLNRFDYVFKVVKGDDVNAFSIPGGFIYVYEGLVNFSESDDELASVLAHEIAHASFRHLATIRRESDKVNWLQLPLLIVAATTRSRDAMNALMAAQLTGQALQSGWSVEAEEAADFGSVQYLVRSRYNPVGGLTFMERLGRRSEFDARPDWGIYRTHPPSQERARSIQGRLRQAGVEIRRSKVSKTFSVQLTSLEDGGIRATFGKTNLHTFRGDGAAERAKQAQAKLNSFFDTVPALFAVKLDGNAVYGGETRLFEVAPEDVPENGDRSSVARRSFEGTRRAVSNLAYSLWSSGAGS
jgi:predicted Zn-dependent protease